jgi:hypothetical protein
MFDFSYIFVYNGCISIFKGKYMKTLAVIKNELFKDYVKIVSTDNLQKTLDNPEIPVPYTCMESVNNDNSEALVGQLASYFNKAKLPNKEFFLVDDDQTSQLSFMVNLIKLSSGDNTSTPVPQPVKPTVTPVKEVPVAPVVKEVVPEEVIESVDPEPVVDTMPIEEHVEVAEEIEPTIAPTVSADVSHAETPVVETSDAEFDPFKVAFTEPTPEPVVTEKTPEVTSNATLGDNIALFNIPANSTLHFSKNDSITAILVDESTVNFEGENLALSAAAKIALKKAGAFGMANGLTNWLYNGKTLQQLKDEA